MVEAVASFTRMEDGTREDYEILEQYEKPFIAETADRVLETLKSLKGSLGGYQLSRYDHCLQSATLAYEDGQDEEMVVAALLHDIGDILAPQNHSEVAAAVLRPYVSEKTYWIIKHHGAFQFYYFGHHYDMDRNVREKFKDSPWYQDCIDFCYKYDQCAFDPKKENKPLSFFEPMVRRIFERKPFVWDVGTKED